MRVGIITQVILNNYGGALQNYALQRVLVKMGHEPVTLDYIPEKSIFRVILSLLLTPFLFFTTKRRSLEECLPCKRDKKFESFISQKMSVTRRIVNYSPSLIDEYNLDAIIVGSDQVWRPKYNEDVLYNTFLEFSLGYNIKRIAYAASFGVSTWEFSKEQQMKCSELIKMFDAVSVREETGVELCKKYFGVKAQLVLDPTLLLTCEDYKPLLKKELYNNDFILTYVLNPSDSILKIVMLKEKDMGIPVLPIKIERNNHYSIEEWLTLFYKSKFVITDSFHGTVFSIIFHKPFYVIDNPQRGSARILTLLQFLGLEKRFVKDIKSFNNLKYIKDIDWLDVDARFEQAKENSLFFLKNSLNNVK